tara:strand:- start:61 stop:345 length:285 start_codon:yes stop_codon:yes gene_type:complete
MKLKSKDEIIKKLIKKLEDEVKYTYKGVNYRTSKNAMDVMMRYDLSDDEYALIETTGQIKMLKWALSIEESKLDIDEITEQVKEELLKQNNKES